MRAYIDALAREGIAGSAIDVRKARIERAAAAWAASVPPSHETVVGGRSYGGRVASVAAAHHRYHALILISYPLHPPGRPAAVAERTAHWPSITCPTLLLAGDRDPFAEVDLLESAVALLPHAELVIYPGGGHGLLPQVDDIARRIAAFLRDNAGQ